MKDTTLDFVRHGYRYSDRLRADRPDHDAVETRFLGRRTVLARGPRAAEVFTDPDLVERGPAMPAVIAGPLFGRDAVHSFDGDRHGHRKQMFVDLAMDPGQIAQLLTEVEREWDSALAQWRRAGGGQVYDTAVDVIGVAVLRWAGWHPTGTTELELSRRLAQLVDDFGVPGLPYLRAWRNRAWSDAQATRDVGELRRRGEGDDSPMAAIAFHRDTDGELLPAHVAGVELQNLVRPTIAVARFVAFAALALIENPGWRDRIAQGSETPGPFGAAAAAFAHEVRRIYPFVPMLPGDVKREVDIDGVTLHEGDRLLLDVVGSNRNPHVWPAPDRFDPSRFEKDDDAAQRPDLVPQGAGDPTVHHRCPGEDITLAIIGLSMEKLAPLDWTVPEQDLGYSTARMPTKPRSGVVLRLTGAA